MSACHWCHGDCGATCLGLTRSTQMPTSDPAYFMLTSGPVTPTTVYRDNCYICRDPEFAQMGLPVCTFCPACKTAGRGEGHIPADDVACSDCGDDSVYAAAMEALT